jgi:glucose-6-phosphate 1-dehydrogenase
MPLEAPEPQSTVIFGATGDLARRKIFPALYHLACRDMLPERYAVVGSGSRDWGDAELRERAEAAIHESCRTDLDAQVLERLLGSMSYVALDARDPAAFERLGKRLHELDRELRLDGRRLYYLATPPSLFAPIAEGLTAAGLATPGSRIVVEKPFGDSLEGARELTRRIQAGFDESRLFRIDHYLGKETVQNIVVFRFGNALFERVWNRDAIDHIQLTVAEDIGVEGRADYYDASGAIRDLLQNHMLQVLSFVTMEPPRALEAEAFRDEKVKLLCAVRPLDPARVVRGQYEGYRDEPGVAPGSTTETFVAAELWIENWRWDGVPIFLRHGKRLPRRATEITVRFREPPSYLFAELGIGHVPADHLTIRIQPDEGISLAFQAKVPGPGYELTTVRMVFDYEQTFMHQPAEAYERLLHDAMAGDHTLFTRADGVERAWEIVEPVLERPGEVHRYAPGTWGPASADELIAPRRWHLH